MDCLSFNQYDLLRVIGAPKDLLLAVQLLLQSMNLLQSESWKDQRNNAFEFKLHGNPWLAAGEATMSTRMLLLRLVETLEASGWRLYASVDQSESSDGETADSWYCVKASEKVSGDTVFYR